ncbi:MAG: DMT family transporter [Desulfobacteraceae bacterium]|nr:DMT family transporter [Desulfobacteraceae bacterium]
MGSIAFVGEFYSVLTAFVWAVAVIFFKKSGETVHPIMLNIFKNILAFILYFFTIMLIGIELPSNVSIKFYVILIASGALGIGVADTFFFASLNRLGAGLSAIVDCMYSPSIIILSVIFLNEKMTFWQIIGVLLILSAILTITGKKGRVYITKPDLFIGIFYGAIAMITMAISIVMVKHILATTNVLFVVQVRFIGGIAVMLLILGFHPKRTTIYKSLFTKKNWIYTIAGSFTGAYLATIIWMAGMKYTQASIASALNQTSSLFIFIFAAMVLHEPLNRYRVAGLFLGVTGVFFVILG